MKDGNDVLRARMRWVEIDHGALVHNVGMLRQMLGPSELWAVVKGQAYGHGAVETARTVLDAGADGLTVSSLSEAVDLRTAGVNGPLLVMNPVLPEQADMYVKHDLIATVADETAAAALSAAAENSDRPVPVHVKVDTGLSRYGTDDDVIEFIGRLHSLPNVEIGGIFSHFACADAEDQRSVRGQLRRFNEFLSALSDADLRPPAAHMCNSAGAIVLPEARLQMVRNGLSVYGMYSSASVRERALEAGVHLRPAMTLKARVSSVRRLAAGSPVGYGSTYTTERPTTAITLPIGYADGVSRNLSGKLEVLVHGRRRPLIGRVCMNHVIVDAGDVPMQIGDVVTLLGAAGDERVAAEEWADHLGTIAYEIVCMVGNRNPRVHMYDR